MNRLDNILGPVTRFFLGRSLAECADGGRDNILVLRLLAALLVILGHSYVLIGQGAVARDPLCMLQVRAATHEIGVMMFFTISGFLITLSWQRRPRLGRFLRARALRLWPALIVCVLAWAFVIGPVLTNLPPDLYFTRGDSFGSVYGYAAGNISMLQMRWFLPGVFASNPVARYVNGSLWTIPVEALMYLCVACLGAVRLLRLPWLASSLIAALFGWLLLWPMYTGRLPYAGLVWTGLVLAGFFGAGSIACLLRRHVRISTGLMLVILVATLFAQRTIHAMPFIYLFVSYFVLWFAYVPRLPTMARGLDPSYGVYLWAFPVQQLLVQAGVAGVPLLFLAATPIVLVIGVLSWSYVEKPCLRLKENEPDAALDAPAAMPSPVPGFVRSMDGTSNVSSALP